MLIALRYMSKHLVQFFIKKHRAQRKLNVGRIEQQVLNKPRSDLKRSTGQPLLGAQINKNTTGA